MPLLWFSPFPQIASSRLVSLSSASTSTSKPRPIFNTVDVASLMILSPFQSHSPHTSIMFCSSSPCFGYHGYHSLHAYRFVGAPSRGIVSDLGRRSTLGTGVGRKKEIFFFPRVGRYWSDGSAVGSSTRVSQYRQIVQIVQLGCADGFAWMVCGWILPVTEY
jgi:hypothetical protein